MIIKAAHVDQLGADARAGRAHPSAARIDAASASELKYRDFLTVALMIRSEDMFPDNWIYIHDPKVKVGRIQNFRSWSPEMVPDPALACVGLEYFCFEGDGLWASSDEDLVELAKKEMAILGLCDPADVDRRRGRAAGEGLSGLRRGISPPTSRRSATSWRAPTRRCTWSAATACTATTTRTTR